MNSLEFVIMNSLKLEEFVAVLLKLLVGQQVDLLLLFQTLYLRLRQGASLTVGAVAAVGSFLGELGLLVQCSPIV